MGKIKNAVSTFKTFYINILIIEICQIGEFRVK